MNMCRIDKDMCDFEAVEEPTSEDEDEEIREDWGDAVAKWYVDG